MSLPVIPPLDPNPPTYFQRFVRTSWSFNGNKSGLDGDLNYSHAGSSVLVLVPMRQPEIVLQQSFVVRCGGVLALELEVIALTTLGDRQGLFGMNVLHFGPVFVGIAGEEEKFEVAVQLLHDNFWCRPVCVNQMALSHMP